MSVFKANVNGAIKDIIDNHNVTQIKVLINLFSEIVKDNYTKMDSAEYESFLQLQGQNTRCNDLIKSLSTKREYKYKDYV